MLNIFKNKRKIALQDKIFYACLEMKHSLVNWNGDSFKSAISKLDELNIDLDKVETYPTNLLKRYERNLNDMIMIYSAHKNSSWTK